MIEQLETSNLKPFSDTRGAKGEPLNGQRAERISAAMRAYSATREDHCVTTEPADLQEMITDILHCAHAQNFDLRAIVADAIIDFRDETGVR